MIRIQSECELCGEPIPLTRRIVAKFCSSTCKTRASKIYKYGITAGEYRELLSETKGKCPICGRKTKRWNVDHNHRTMETTGITCSNCNGYLLAFTYHDPKIARRLAEYLENPPVTRKYGPRLTRNYSNTPVGGRWNRR